MPVRRVLLAGILAGLVAGIVATGLQALRVSPLILAAEVYETAAPLHDHDGAEAGAWEPAEGLERAAFTLLANLVVASGFGLLLAAGFAWRHIASGSPPSLRVGLLWGLAGFVTFSLAPAFGLPPAPPGSLVAGLAARQTWWLLTVAATGSGLCFATWARSWRLKLLALPLLALPHLIGAPAAPPGESGVPLSLAREFAIASLATAAMFWIVLGAIGGWIYARLEPSPRR